MSVQPIPARSSTYAHLLQGQTLKIINTHGNQIVDTWAVSAPPSLLKSSRHHSQHDQNRNGSSQRRESENGFAGQPAFSFSFLSTTQTRTALLKLTPATGDAIYDNNRQPLLTITADTSGGAHDLLLATCDQMRYVQMGATEPHENCADNFRRALRTALQKSERSPRYSSAASTSNSGFAEIVQALRSAAALSVVGGPLDLGWLPDPVKLFINWPVQAFGDGVGGGFSFEPPVCSPGGYIALRAERECVVIMCACPMDVFDDTGYGNQGAEFEVLAANTGEQ